LIDKSGVKVEIMGEGIYSTNSGLNIVAKEDI
jgi:hypothetical protein